MKYYAYIIADANSGPFYVGKGCGYRVQRHLDGNSKNPALQAAIAAAGDRLQITRADGLSESEALELERLLIAVIGRQDRADGPLLNRTSGGQGTAGRHWFKHSEETKAKIRASIQGRKRSPKTLAAMREAGRRRMQTEEGQRTMQKAKDVAADMTRTPEWRAKLSAAAHKAKEFVGNDPATGRFVSRATI
jgi:hypothetical protein